jgi:hypothetical protein
MVWPRRDSGTVSQRLGDLPCSGRPANGCSRGCRGRPPGRDSQRAGGRSEHVSGSGADRSEFQARPTARAPRPGRPSDSLRGSLRLYRQPITGCAAGTVRRYGAGQYAHVEPLSSRRRPP